MKKSFLIITLLSSLSLFGNMDMSQMMGSMPEPTFRIENRILANVNETAISVLDVKKRMDLLFHKNYPDLSDNDVARFQFYQASWRHTLDEMINTELMIADSIDKELKVSDGDVHEEIMQRFGPNVVTTLEEIGITHSEAEKMVKNEMIVQRMMWFYVHQKALQNIHPADVRIAFRDFSKENPPKETWSYQVVSLRGGEAKTESEKLYAMVKNSDQNLQDIVDLFESAEGTKIQLSKEFTVEGSDLSKMHKQELEKLEIGEYSTPATQKSRHSGQEVHRIFHLKDFQKTPAPAFRDKYEDLRMELLYSESDKLAKSYIDKLREYYGYENLIEEIPDDFQPFVMQ